MSLREAVKKLVRTVHSVMQNEYGYHEYPLNTEGYKRRVK